MFPVNVRSDSVQDIVIMPSQTEERVSSVSLSQLAISTPIACTTSLLDIEAEKNKALLEQINQAILTCDPVALKNILEPLPRDVCRALLNTLDEDGDKTPLLHKCATTGDIQSMGVLLEYGADPLLVNAKGENFVHRMVQENRLKMLKSFFETVSMSTAMDLVNARDSSGETALFISCKIPKGAPYVNLLLDAGADPLQTDKDESNILHIATAYGYPKLLKNLLARFSKDETLEKEVLGKLINATNKDGDTPLILSCYYGKFRCAELLLKAKADPWIFNNNGEFPYVLAVLKHHEAIAHLLLKEDPKLAGAYALLILGNVFGLEPEPTLSGKKVPFPGSSEHFIHYLVSRTLQNPIVRERFFSLCNQEQYDELAQAVSAASLEEPPLKEMVEKIHEGKLVILAAGWDEHAISLIFRDGYLVICNRGQGCHDENGNERTFFVRKISQDQVTEDLLEKALSYEVAHVDISKQFFYGELPQSLSATEDDFSKAILAIQPKPINVGICAFGAAKASLRASLALLTKDNEAARVASKAWATWYRERALGFFQKTPSPFEKSFLQKTIGIQSNRLKIRKQTQLIKYLHKLKDHVANKLPLDGILNEIETFCGRTNRKKLESCLVEICRKKKIKNFSLISGRKKFLDRSFSSVLKQRAIDLFIKQIDPKKKIRNKPENPA